MTGITAPAQRLTGAMALGIAIIGAVILLTLHQPWLGIALAWDNDTDTARVVASGGPAAAIPPGTLVTRIGNGSQLLTLSALDFIVEPDGNLPTLTDYRDFLQRQDRLSSILHSDTVTLDTRDDRSWTLMPTAWRPATDLPADFWVQIAVGLTAWLICAGVWAFRPGDVAARYLLLSGFATLMFSPGAAVYTTRELAIGLPELWLLKTMNFGGGLLYCGTLAALLWHYPTRLGSSRISVAIVASFMLWFLAQETGLIESMQIARRLPVYLALLATLALATVQWHRTRRDPLARAALRWFLLAWLLMSSLFALLVMVPQLHGLDTGAIQGYSFLLFLLVYGGLALGVLRYRLFDLGDWWAHILSWIVGAVLLVMLDLVLVFALQMAPDVSLGLALVLCGLIWLPLRNRLWERWYNRRQPDPTDLFRHVLEVSLTPNITERTRRWQALARQHFQPLQLSPLMLARAVSEPAITENGLAMLLPGYGELPTLRLSYAWQGRRLFNRQDLTSAAQMHDMLRHASDSRDAYQRGVSEERLRIARDLHDNIGTHLLTALHHADPGQSKAAVSQGIDEMQDIIRGLTGQAVPLPDLVADLRHETALRLCAAGVALDWPCALDEARHDTPMIDYHQYRHYVAVMRELISNVLRHSHATRLGVCIQADDTHLFSTLTDDGIGFDGQRPEHSHGHGLASLQQRLALMGGTLTYSPHATGGTCTTLTLRLCAPVAVAS